MLVALSLVTCTGTNSVTYSPALTNTARPTTITSGTDLSSCLFIGATASEQTTLLGDLTACSGAGISANSGPSLLH